MLHPHTELRFINEQIGYGVVATHFIPRGTVTWVRDDFDQAFSVDQVERMAPLYRDIVAKYCFVDSRGDFILCWDLARYVNHSCDPSCRSAGYDFELAVRDIHPDDLLIYAEQWDQIVAEPFRLMPTVAQPLWPLVKDKKTLEAVLACRMPIASCRDNYHPLPTLQPAEGQNTGDR